MYNIINDQCSKLMKNKLMMVKGFKEMETKWDDITLLKEIRAISLQIETNISVYNTLDEVKYMYYGYSQEGY